MELTWLGRSCFEPCTRRRQRVLFDPYLAPDCRLLVLSEMQTTGL